MTLLVSVANFAQAQNQDYLNYIEQYKDVAIREMERAGIPASIKLAQALLESGAGKSDLARRANNHFGIKCNKEWDGKTFYKKDDDYDDKGRLIESCFRSYKNPEASFIAHSEFLLDPTKYERYGFLFRLEPTDYKRWARGLRSAGYATDPRYANRLIDLIERYNLHQYDLMLPTGKSEDVIVNDEVYPGEPVNGFMVNNDVKYVIAFDNEPLEEIAKRTFTSVSSLLNYNEELRSGDQRLPEGRKVYIQPKRNSYRGKQTWHYVEPGETMAEISNKYAIDLSKLYERNLMQIGDQPVAKERIKIRGGKVDNAPKLKADVAKVEPLQSGFLFDGFEEEEAFLDTMEVDVELPADKVTAQQGTKPETNEDSPVTVVDEKPQTLEPVAPKKEQTNNQPTVPVVPVSDVSKADDADEEITFEEDIFEDSKPAPKKETNSPTDTYVLHTVMKGDTLWNISQRYNTSVSEIKKLNDLNSNNIRLGMKLKVK